MNIVFACPERIDLDVGPVSAVNLALFAAASGDHNPLHLDAEIARAAGFDRPLIHGMLSMACASRLFTANFGATAVKSLSARFVGAAKLGECLHFSAQFVLRDEATATYRVEARTQAGNEVLRGSATVVLPSVP
jgi:acyl dehydratase